MSESNFSSRSEGNLSLKTQEAREVEKNDFLDEAFGLINKYKIPGLEVGQCSSEVNSGYYPIMTNIKTIIVFGESDAAFLLYEEQSPEMDRGFVKQADLGELEKFLKNESEFNEVRNKFLPRVLNLIEKNEKLNNLRSDSDIQKYDISFVTYDGKISGNADFYPARPGPNSAHELKYCGNNFNFSDEDISKLEELVLEQEMAQEERLNNLKTLFMQSNGEFTETQEKKSAFAGHSLSDGRAKHDEWTEIAYFIGGERISEKEYEWLKIQSKKKKTRK